MPRKPTGRPRGRPLGSGVLGAHTRLTVRIPTPLYDRLKAYAAGHTTAGDPELADSVRLALEHFLGCPYIRQPENDTYVREDIMRQTKSVPPGGLDFDRKKYRLGPPGLPCTKAGHLSHGADGNLKELMSGVCVACVAAKKAAKKATKERTHQPALVAQEG